jgi:hypothetical protein
MCSVDRLTAMAPHNTEGMVGEGEAHRRAMRSENMGSQNTTLIMMMTIMIQHTDDPILKRKRRNDVRDAWSRQSHA